MLRKARKILTLLKKNKNSWPFRQPVDPIVMGIPHYYSVVPNPMDLNTMWDNLLNLKYRTVSQFYADVHLIINNSYMFNKNNVQFCKITAEFEKYFQGLKDELPSTVFVQPYTPRQEISSYARQIPQNEEVKCPKMSSQDIYLRK